MSDPQVVERDGRSIGWMTLLNLLGGIAGILNSIVTAYLFGSSREIEIYFAAVGLQTSVTSLVQGGQLSEAFMPIYQDIRTNRNREDAFRAFSIILNWMLLGAAVLALIAFLLAYPLMKIRVPGFAEDDIIKAATLFKLAVPLVLIQIASNMLVTLANAEKWFGLPEAINVGSRVCLTISVLALATQFGISGLLTSLWIGLAVALIGQIVMTRRLGYRHRFAWRMKEFHPGTVFQTLFYTFGYTLVTQFYSFALDAALSSFRPGVYAIAKYVTMLYSRVRGIIMRPISTVYFTQFARAFSEGADNLKLLSATALSRTLFVCAVVTTIGWTSSTAGLAFLWGSERFPPEDIRFAALLLGLLFSAALLEGWASICRKTAVSLGLIRSVYIFSMVTNACSGLFCLVLPSLNESWIPVTVIGAPLAMQLTPSVALWIWRREYTAWYSWNEIARWSVCSVVAISLTKWLETYITPNLSLENRWNSLGMAVGCVVASVAILLSCALLLQVPQVSELARVVRTRIRT